MKLGFGTLKKVAGGEPSAICHLGNSQDAATILRDCPYVIIGPQKLPAKIVKSRLRLSDLSYKNLKDRQVTANCWCLGNSLAAV